MSILDWNEAQVNQFFISLGLNRFESAINEHGLTGDVLVHLDNELLKDIGIQSVGKRLAILKAIYKLKIQDDIPIEDGQWVPPLGDLDQNESDDTASSTSVLTPPHKHPFTHLIQARDDKIKNLEYEIRSIKLELQSFAARLMSSTPTSPSLLDSNSIIRGAQDRHMREESVSQLDIPDPSPASPPIVSHHNPTTSSQDEPRPSRTESPVPSLNCSSQEPPPHQPSHQDPPSVPSPSSVSATPKPNDPSSKSDSTENKEKVNKEKDSTNPYKSFRVTLEDPCYKVLPAALKKYKIKEHYKNYVLFICYGKQERCLSYDEKPLLLFQKLKDAHQNPVFTLRHIKDIESPVSLALAKHAQRREKRLASEAENQDPSKSNQVKPRRSPPNMGQFEPASGFCIAIYPYMPEGKDDLDVGVGDTFIIIGKSKGWWVLNRDKGPETKVSQENQGWIPSGCLLETNQSFTIGTSGKTDYQTKILPDQILSVSTACYGLMDFVPKGLDELGFEINDSLKVYKKYNNWSYAINESKPEKPRGWTPSWLIGTKKDKETQSSQQLQISSPNSIQTNVSGSSSNFGSSCSSSTTTTHNNNNQQQLQHPIHSSSNSRTLKPSSSSSSIFSTHRNSSISSTSTINNKRNSHLNFSNDVSSVTSASSSTLSSSSHHHHHPDKVSNSNLPSELSSASTNTTVKDLSNPSVT